MPQGKSPFVCSHASGDGSAAGGNTGILPVKQGRHPACRCRLEYGFGGVRPSSGAETLENDGACEMSDTLERAEFAAAEDGRTPVNKYQAGRLSYVQLHREPPFASANASVP